jgi:hypothetical protein
VTAALVSGVARGSYSSLAFGDSPQPTSRVASLKLGHRVAATTIRSVLLDAGVPPSRRRSQLTWKQFLATHAETLVAADFFGVDTIFFRRLYVFIYVRSGVTSSAVDAPS